MARRKTLGKSTTIRLAVPMKLHDEIIRAANDDRRTVSEFLRLMAEDYISKRKEVIEDGKSSKDNKTSKKSKDDLY